MRVLFYYGDKQWSGCARATLDGARGLLAREHPVTIACCEGTRLEDEARRAGIETVLINVSATAAGDAWDLRKVIKDRFVEVVIVTTERDQLIVSSARLFADRGAVLRRIPSFDAIDLQQGGKLALRMASSGLILSTDRERQTVKSLGWAIPPAVAPLGVDTASYESIEPVRRSAIGAPLEGLLIACSYDASGRTRIASLFRTLALLGPRRRNMHAVVFGPDSLDESLRMHASALGVGQYVTFLGEPDDTKEIMRAAHAGWVVSGGDSAAYACLDFMALQTPVIAERTPLAQHYVADGITGKLLSTADPSYTASAVAAFLSSEDTLAAMGNTAWLRAQREFPEGAMFDGFEHAINAAGDRTQWAKKK
jgi:glycosyltransferase involved in cell wall biosynthesis